MEITYQRAIKFLKTKRIVESYEKLAQHSFSVSDVLGGQDAWCDFQSNNDWGECVSAYQEKPFARLIHQKLFEIEVPTFELTYSIKIDPKSFPTTDDCIPFHYPVNSIECLKKELGKKLKKHTSSKRIPFQKRAF